MFFDAKWLHKCSKNTFVELPSPPKSHQHWKMGSKAIPRGTKNRPRRVQVEQKGAQGDPKWPREPPKCDLLLHKIGMGTSWLDPVLFRRRFACIFHWFGIKFAWIFYICSCNFCAFLATIWKTWVGWGVGESTLSKCTSIRIKFLQDQIQWLARCGIALQLGYIYIYIYYNTYMQYTHVGYTCNTNM